MHAVIPHDAAERPAADSLRNPDLVVIDLLGGLCPERERVWTCLAAALSDADLSASGADVARLAELPTRAALLEWVVAETRLAPEVVRPLVAAVHEDFRTRLMESVKGCGLGTGARVVKVAGSAADARAGILAGCVAVVSLAPDLAAGRAPLEDLGDLAERLLGHPLP